MSTEIVMLAAAGGLALAITVVQAVRNVLVLGLSTAAGNQHEIDPWEGANDRLNRALRNLIEAIAIFAPIAIAVYLLDAGTSVSALGAKIFVGARIVHAVVYTVGIPWVRTTAWFVGVVGILMVASALI